MVLHHLSVFLKWLVDDGAKNLTEEFSEIKFGEKMRKPCFVGENKVTLWCKVSPCLATESLKVSTKAWDSEVTISKAGAISANEENIQNEMRSKLSQWCNPGQPKIKRWEEQRGYPPTKDLRKNYKDEDDGECVWHMRVEYWRCYMICITCSRGTVT